ncbi:MAG TPA: right-handed parallel beta-helix repeat-containing protein, partial [Methylococcales bacterium]
MASCETATADRYFGNGYYTLINLSNGSNYSVHDMVLQDGCNDGLQVSHASDVRFYNNYVNAMGHEGVFALVSHGLEVYGNNFIIRASDGVRGDDCYDYSIHNNEFSSYNKKDSSAGIQIDNKQGKAISNIQIFNNLFHDIWNGGIWLSVGSAAGSGTSWPVSIHHNIFVGNGYSTNSAVGPTGGIMSPANIASIIYNNTFDGNYGNGIYDPNGKSKIISNIITGTVAGKYASAGKGVGVSGGAEVSYNVFNKNVGGDYTKGGTGNYTGDPLYYKPGTDYHLQSMAGRWDPALSQWVADAKNSPAIDAGIPLATDATYGVYTNEPKENGSRLNAGAYGNTPQASLTGTVKQVPMPPAPTSGGAAAGA